MTEFVLRYTNVVQLRLPYHLMHWCHNMMHWRHHMMLRLVLMHLLGLRKAGEAQRQRSG